jgi:hypothetical protein
MGMREKLYRLIRDFLFNAPDVSDMNLAEYLITNGVTIPVRCKDCKYFKDWGDGNKTCDYWTDQWDCATDSDAYCSYGERKDNET